MGPVLNYHNICGAGCTHTLCPHNQLLVGIGHTTPAFGAHNLAPGISHPHTMGPSMVNMNLESIIFSHRSDKVMLFS